METRSNIDHRRNIVHDDNGNEKIDIRLKECRDHTLPFGGISIIFSGDFRQLEPVSAPESDFLFTSQSGRFF